MEIITTPVVNSTPKERKAWSEEASTPAPNPFLQEDKTLSHIVSRMEKPKWGTVAALLTQKLPSSVREGKQCRER